MGEIYFTRSKNRGITADIIQNEAVIVNLHTGTYYSLVDEGAEVWQSLNGAVSLKQLVAQVQSRYAGNEGEIAESLGKLLVELEKEALIEREEGPRTTTETFTQVSDSRSFRAPILSKFTDMQELILIDPIHETDESGWPNSKPRTL